MSENYSGACFCGAVEVEVSGQPEAMGYCHCQSCRSWSASPVNAFTLWKPENVKVTKGADQIGAYHKTEKHHRQFCRTCGGHVMSSLPAWGLIDVFAATIKDFTAAASCHLRRDGAAHARRASENEGLSCRTGRLRRSHCRIERLCCFERPAGTKCPAQRRLLNGETEQAVHESHSSRRPSFEQKTMSLTRATQKSRTSDCPIRSPERYSLTLSGLLTSKKKTWARGAAQTLAARFSQRPDSARHDVFLHWRKDGDRVRPAPSSAP